MMQLALLAQPWQARLAPLLLLVGLLALLVPLRWKLRLSAAAAALLLAGIVVAWGTASMPDLGTKCQQIGGDGSIVVQCVSP